MTAGATCGVGPPSGWPGSTNDAEQLDTAQRAFGLTATERDWIGTLVPGRALWLIGSGYRAVVQHHLTAAERDLVDTDQRMRQKYPGGFDITEGSVDVDLNPRVAVPDEDPPPLGS